MSIKLKIKSKSLAEEIKIIRIEEKKICKEIRRIQNKQGIILGSSWWIEGCNIPYDKRYKSFHSIHQHRMDLRLHARATHIVRGYISGKTYLELERKRKPEKEFEFTHRVLPKVNAMLDKYCKPKDAEGFRDWFDKGTIKNSK